MQMSDEDVAFRRLSKLEEVPPLTALKDTFLLFFQFCKEAVFQIAIKPTSSPRIFEDDVPSRDACNGPDVYGLVVHHGLRRDSCTGTPVADLSICFLSPPLLDIVIPWWFTLTQSQLKKNECLQKKGGRSGIRTIRCCEDEYELLHQFVAMFSSCAKDNSTWKVDPARHPVPIELRCYFTRVLVPLLFPHQKVLMSSEILNIVKQGLGGNSEPGSSEMTEDSMVLRMIKRFKAEGVELVRNRQHETALEPFRKAVKMCSLSRTESAVKLAAQCHLNMAICWLALAISAPATSQDVKANQTIEGCESALELLKPEDVVMRAKAYYRKGLALEILKQKTAAEMALTSSCALSNDTAIHDALARVKSMPN